MRAGRRWSACLDFPEKGRPGGYKTYKSSMDSPYFLEVGRDRSCKAMLMVRTCAASPNGGCACSYQASPVFAAVNTTMASRCAGGNDARRTTSSAPIPPCRSHLRQKNASFAVPRLRCGLANPNNPALARVDGAQRYEILFRISGPMLNISCFDACARRGLVQS